MSATMIRRWPVWTALMLVTGLLAAVLGGLVAALSPAGVWKPAVLALMIAVTWPMLTWSLRAAGRWLRLNALDAAYVLALRLS
jgi:hypothetical protein